MCVYVCVCWLADIYMCVCVCAFVGYIIYKRPSGVLIMWHKISKCHSVYTQSKQRAKMPDNAPSSTYLPQSLSIAPPPPLPSLSLSLVLLCVWKMHKSDQHAVAINEPWSTHSHISLLLPLIYMWHLCKFVTQLDFMWPLKPPPPPLPSAITFRLLPLSFCSIMQSIWPARFVSSISA